MRKFLFIIANIFIFPIFIFGQSGTLPDKSKTPGEIRGDSLETICISGYTKIVRNVSKNRKIFVFNYYGIEPIYRKYYVIDHLIPLGLGGSNDISNLWAQDKRPKFWNDTRKNQLGNYLRKKVCKGEIDLKEAQDAMAEDWIAAYEKYILKK